MMGMGGDVPGWSGYYDNEIVGSMGNLGDMAGFDYQPDLASVGSGSAYYPRNIFDDAAALNQLGFLPDLEGVQDTMGSSSKDMANGVGAWWPPFRAAVTAFQRANGGLTVDGWIGPNTRRALLAAMNVSNANPSPVPVVMPPSVIPGVPPTFNPQPAPPAVLVKPTPKPAAKPGTDNALLYAAGAAIVLVGGAAYYHFRK